MNLCYVLVSQSEKKTYCGYTNRFPHRLRCHNGEIQGGAKYTQSDRPWRPLFIVSGFSSKRQALRFEYAMKHTGIKQRGILGRIMALQIILHRPRWARKERPSLLISWHSYKAYELAQTHIVLPVYATYNTMNVF